MDEYQRVTPTAHDDDDDDDDDNDHDGDSDGELSYSDHRHHSRQSTMLDSEAQDASPPRRHRGHDRITTTSRGSYTSVIRHLGGRISHEDDEDGEYDNKGEEDNTHIADLDTGENSPLHRSRDGEDGEDNDKAAQSPYPPNRVNASSILFGSDDSDDDEDEYEEQLKRYSLDFRPSATSASTTVLPTSSSQNHSLWAKIQHARQKARQRRAEYLLQQSERQTWRQSIYLFLVMTLCDATDTGIALVAVGLVAWFILMWKMSHHRSLILWGGLVVWSIRLGSRPVRDFFIQRRVRRHQQQERERRGTYSGGYNVRQDDGTAGMMMIRRTHNNNNNNNTSMVFPVRRFEDSSHGDLSFATKTKPSSMELSATSERGTAHFGNGSSDNDIDQSSSIPHFLL